jgi:hypothetical protein
LIRALHALTSDTMEDQMKSETSAAVLESKREEIEKVKNRYNKIIMQKLGKLLVEELSRVAGNEQPNQDQYIILKLPKFLKSLLNFFNNDQLLIETGLLFIIFSLNLLDDEMQIRYRQNISSIQIRKDDLSQMKDLLWVNLDPTPDCICKFRLPSYLFPAYPLFEKYMPDLAIFGILKIFEWLDLLNSTVCSLIRNYEGSFHEVYKRATSR